MRNPSLLALVALSSACALRTHGDAPHSLASAQPSWERTEPVTAPGASAAPAPAVTAAPATAAVAVPKLFHDDGYTRLSLGVFDPSGDIKALDTGYYAQVAVGGDVLRFLALEASLGYATADGPGDTELRLVPLFVNARAQLPIVIFELYGGLGVGGMWADYEFGADDDSEFLLAGTAFAGAEVGLGKLALGLEYRYIASEETDRDFAIEGHCGLVTLTLPF
jgi:opacity protein-like surface antigen